MQIEIDIPEDKYNQIVNSYQGSNVRPKDYEIAIINGTPLPKGHGRLGDLDIFKKELEKYWNERKGLCYADIESIVDLLVPTALKADNDMRGDTE